MNKKFYFLKNIFSNIDYMLITLCVTASIINLLCMYSFYITEQRSFKTILIQSVAFIIGIILAIAIANIDYVVMANLWKIYMPISLLLVILTFFIGVDATPFADDKAWLDLGFTTLQPSELLKLSFIFTFSLHLSKVGSDINKVKNFFMLCLHGLFPIAIVMVQGDYGTALVFFAIFVFLMFVAGLSLRLILISLFSCALLAPIVWIYVLPDYLRERFYVAQRPEDYLNGAGRGWQQYMGRIAFGSGGIYGRGIEYENLYKVPEAHNDFIFSFIGQTMGFIGAIIVLLLILTICIKILVTGINSKDKMGVFIGTGVFAMFLFQSVINIGMVLCVIPVIGITLPFFSAGGTSVLVSYIAIGMVMSIYKNNKRNLMFD